MAQQVFLHIGAPKSGTTYLQTLLWNHRDLLREHGVLVPGETLFDFNRAAMAMRLPHFGAKAGDVWNHMGEAVRRWDGTAIVSCEWFCLTPQSLVERAVEHFGGDIDVVYTARDLSGLVPAAWQESLKLGTGQSLDDFVAALDQDHERWTWWTLDPAEVLARWCPPLSPQRIHVVTLPPPGSERATLWRRFAGICGIDDVEVDPGKADTNESLSVESAALLQRLGPNLRTAIDAVNLPWHQPYRWLRRYFAHDVLRPHGEGRIALRPEDAASVAARAQQSVATMRAAGYDVVGDLDDLLRTMEARHPDDVSSEEQLDIAIEVIATLLADVRRRTLRAERLARTLAASPDAPDDAEGDGREQEGAQVETAHTREASPRGSERVYYLVGNLDGRGGVARSVIEQANRVAEHRSVEIISVLRKHDEPSYPIAPGIGIRYLVDHRSVAGAFLRPGRKNTAQDPLSELDRQRSRFAILEPTFSGLTDARLAEALATLEPGILVSTRPSLHRAATELAPAHMVRIGQEHLNLQTRREDQTWPRVRATVEGLDILTTLTDADKQDWTEELADTTVSVDSVPNPLSWPLTEKAALSSKVIVAAGRLERRKGFVRLCRSYVPVARARPDWELRIYGVGEDHDPLVELIEREDIGDQVRLMGYTDRLEAEFRTASIYAMASHYEGLPMVLLEAASVGLPLVSMDCPRGPSDVIRDGINGRLVPDGDEPALGHALLELIDDPASRQRMGAEAFETAQAYDPDRITHRWLDVFDAALHRRVPG